MTLPTVAVAEPRTFENSKGYTLSITQLDAGDVSNDMCKRDTFSGKVVARSFNDVGIELTGFTVESPNGARDFVNVTIPKDLNMALLGHVTQGLQMLTKIGRHVSGQTFRCGAAGRVVYLDGIK
jgi:hypothetical protein